MEHAWQLRRLIRDRHPALPLGGWANPAADPARQVAFVGGGEFTADFYLTQIVSHHRLGEVEHFLEAAGRAGVSLPGIFGVFYYRSAKPATLDVLSRFLPVPAEALKADFAAGATPVDVCARTIRELRALGVRHFYVSNLPLTRTAQRAARHPRRAGVTDRRRVTRSGFRLRDPRPRRSWYAFPYRQRRTAANPSRSRAASALMGSFLDSVPMSGIVRIRDMMFTIKNPFRLDQGDVSFDAPDTVKQAMIRRSPTTTRTTCRPPACRGCASSPRRSCATRTTCRSSATTR